MYYSTVSFLFVCLRHAHRSRDDAGARPLLAARFFPFCLSVPAPVLIRQRNLTFTHLRPSSPHSNSAGRSHRRLGRACAMRLSKASEFGRDSAKGQSRRRALIPQSRRRRFLTWFPFRSLLSTVSTSVPIHHHGTALAQQHLSPPPPTTAAAPRPRSARVDDGRTGRLRPRTHWSSAPSTKFDRVLRSVHAPCMRCGGHLSEHGDERCWCGSGVRRRCSRCSRDRSLCAGSHLPQAGLTPLQLTRVLFALTFASTTNKQLPSPASSAAAAR